MYPTVLEVHMYPTYCSGKGQYGTSSSYVLILTTKEAHSGALGLYEFLKGRAIIKLNNLFLDPFGLFACFMLLYRVLYYTLIYV